MSEHSVDRTKNKENEFISVLHEERHSLTVNSININNEPNPDVDKSLVKDCCQKCTCSEDKEVKSDKSKKSFEFLDPEKLKKLLEDHSKNLEIEFNNRLENEISLLKEKFDYILHNEQVRASYMLREAHRDRKEKIVALQRQLECKNLTGLMYVLMSERRQSKLEKLRIIEDYTNYIKALQDIMTEAQDVILYLSRGYKTAARVDHEWREKMKKVMKEFQLFVYNFGGGDPKHNQYFFDLPALLSTEAPIVDDLLEDPCDCEDEEEYEIQEPIRDKQWWEMLEGDCKPFVMFGDMADFKPPQRRETLKTIKAAKTAPRKWKEYVFNEMFLRSGCSNLNTIKDEYPNRIAMAGKWECRGVQTNEDAYSPVLSQSSRRITTASIDVRGNMGSILKIITTNNAKPQSEAKATLLGARDSMEIASTTKLRERHDKTRTKTASGVVLNIGSRKTSNIEEFIAEEIIISPEISTLKQSTKEFEEEITEEEETVQHLGSLHHDSLDVISAHVPERDHKINYEKICPMEECQRLKTDSFIRSLPSYMTANPFTHFEQTFDEYEACTPGTTRKKQRGCSDEEEPKNDSTATNSNLMIWKTLTKTESN